MNPDDLLKALGLPLHPAPMSPHAPHAPPAPAIPDLSPEEERRAYDALMASPFADSVKALAGPMVTYAPAHDQPWLGLFQPSRFSRAAKDTVYINQWVAGNGPPGAPPAANWADRDLQPETTLAHEIGHAYALHAPPEGSYPAGWVDVMKTTPRAGTYAATGGPREHYAEAFANAVQYLRATAGMRVDGPSTARDARALLAHYEADVPGVGALVGRLLQHPAYSRHPLRYADTIQTLPDATVAREQP